MPPRHWKRQNWWSSWRRRASHGWWTTRWGRATWRLHCHWQRRRPARRRKTARRRLHSEISHGLSYYARSDNGMVLRSRSGRGQEMLNAQGWPSRSLLPQVNPESRTETSFRLRAHRLAGRCNAPVCRVAIRRRLEEKVLPASRPNRQHPKRSTQHQCANALTQLPNLEHTVKLCRAFVVSLSNRCPCTLVRLAFHVVWRHFKP